MGTVTGTRHDRRHLTLTVTASFRAGWPSANSSVTLTVSSDTADPRRDELDGLGQHLTNVSKGDIVAGGLLAPQGDTLSQIEALPLQILVDHAGVEQLERARAQHDDEVRIKQNALKQALKLLGVKTKTTSHHRKHHKHHVA